MTPAKPFVKWVGGKSRLLAEIRAKYPQRVERYCEPFVGGGAVLFDVLQAFRPRAVLINDINAELMSTYAHVRDDVERLIARLADFQARYASQTGDENKAFFYEQRGRYNALKSDGEAESLEKAALFIFLNKTCFNGLYRVNSRGLFNVPFNGAKAPPYRPLTQTASFTSHNVAASPRSQ